MVAKEEILTLSLSARIRGVHRPRGRPRSKELPKLF